MRIFMAILIFTLSLFSQNFKQDIQKLDGKDFKHNEELIVNLSKIYADDERLTLFLEKFLAGELYLSSDSRVFALLEKDANILHVQDVGDLSKSDVDMLHVQKVRVNNRLRALLRKSISKIKLTSKDRDLRLEASKNILQNLTQDDIEIINEVLQSEKDDKVIDVLQEAWAIGVVQFAPDEQKLEAVKKLGSLSSSNALWTLKELKTDDLQLQKERDKSISQIESIRGVYSFFQTLFFGLSQGSILLLASLGLAITLGVMRVINMAHGELIMIGAYTTFALQQLMPNFIGTSLVLSIPIAFLVSGFFGVVIERLVISKLYGRPLQTLLATFGVSLILQQLVRSIFSPLNQEVKSPSWMSGAWQINDSLSFTYNRLYIIGFALVVFFALLYLMKKSSLGLKIRAVSQNRPIARAMGIRSNYIDAITFGIGAGIAGVAGVALSQLTNVGPNLGQAYIIDSFMVVVFGGVGNLFGTLIASLSLGEISKFLEPYAGAVLAKVIILVLIILFIQKRPRGLFPQKGRDAQE